MKMRAQVVVPATLNSLATAAQTPLQPPTLLHHIAHNQLGLGLKCEFAPDFAPRFINIQILEILIISITLAHFVHKI